MLEPVLLCNRHLLGEHNEIHKLIGCILKKRSLAGYIKKEIVEPQSIITRHDELALEMTRRKMRHKSPVQISEDQLKEYPIVRVNRTSSLRDLMSRCPECLERIQRYNRQTRCGDHKDKENHPWRARPYKG